MEFTIYKMLLCVDDMVIFYSDSDAKMFEDVVNEELNRVIHWLQHRQSKEWNGNAGKIANVADGTSVIRPDTLYFGTLYLHFQYISRLCTYKS